MSGARVRTSVVAVVSSSTTDSATWAGLHPMVIHPTVRPILLDGTSFHLLVVSGPHLTYPETNEDHGLVMAIPELTTSTTSHGRVRSTYPSTMVSSANRLMLSVAVADRWVRASSSPSWIAITGRSKQRPSLIRSHVPSSIFIVRHTGPTLHRCAVGLHSATPPRSRASRST